MIYLVSGYPRSGTSALMQALEAGGLPVVQNSTRTQAVHWMDADGYRMNPGGVYESHARERCDPAWPRRHEGAAIKVPVMWLGALAVHQYRVAVLLRDPEEIRQSYEAAFGTRVTVEAITLAVREGRHVLANRRDVIDMVCLSYDDLIVRPHAALAALAWPIDVDAAAAVLDPAKQRFRRAALAVGA